MAEESLDTLLENLMEAVNPEIAIPLYVNSSKYYEESRNGFAFPDDKKIAYRTIKKEYGDDTRKFLELVTESKKESRREYAKGMEEYLMSTGLSLGWIDEEIINENSKYSGYIDKSCFEDEKTTILCSPEFFIGLQNALAGKNFEYAQLEALEKIDKKDKVCWYFPFPKERELLEMGFKAGSHIKWKEIEQEVI